MLYCGDVGTVASGCLVVEFAFAVVRSGGCVLEWQVCFGALEDKVQPVLRVDMESRDYAFCFLRKLLVGVGVRWLLLGRHRLGYFGKCFYVE